MAKRSTTAGITSYSIGIFVQDSSSTTGGGLTGLVYNTSGLTAEYRRQGQSAWTTITLATKTLGTWTSGGFVNDGGRGYYELDLPDAAVASGARFVYVRLYGATNMVDVPIEIELNAVNYQDAVRFGLTALPNAIAGATSGLHVLGGTGVTLANTAHGGSAATLTFERIIGASTTTNEPAFKMTGNGSAAGMQNIGGATGPGQHNLGGSTSGEGILNEARAGNSNGDSAKGFGSGAGTRSQGGATGNAYSLIGGSTSGAGIAINTQSNSDSIIANLGDGILAMKHSSLTKFETMLVLDGAVYQYTANALELAPGGGTNGSRTVTITVNDGSTVIQGARVRLTKGVDSAVRTTNASGVATFNVDDGTWTVSITASGYTYSGTTLVVDGTETATYSMTAVSISAPASPGLCTVRFEVREADGDTPIQNAVVKAVLDQNCVTSGVLLSNAIHSGTTNASGICDLVLVQSKSIIRGSKCYAITVVDPANASADPLFRFYGTVPNETTAFASELIPRNK